MLKARDRQGNDIEVARLVKQGDGSLKWSFSEVDDAEVRQSVNDALDEHVDQPQAYKIPKPKKDGELPNPDGTQLGDSVRMPLHKRVRR